MKEMEKGPKHLVALDQRVLIISDLHFPYAHPDWHSFLKAIQTHFKPEIVVNVGDEVDGHAISFHESETCLPSADMELEQAIKEVHALRDLFPKMYLCESNHGSLAYRKIKHAGLPIRHLKPLGELYDTPGWSWHHEIMLETHAGYVTIVHGKTGSYNKLALEQGNSSIQGHYHSKFELTWVQSSMNLRFNMIVGCLVDSESMAFNYGKNIAKKPIQGVGWINELGEPTLIRMQLDKHGRWSGKL
mgnify:CR=1 FL=1